MKVLTDIPLSMVKMMDAVTAKLEQEQRYKLAAMFRNCFSNTYLTTMRSMEDGSTFVITGDIPAMWLRDSAAQVRTYLMLAEEDPHIADLIQGVVQRQIQYILYDPYANAFCERPNSSRHVDDLTEMKPYIWERKYEIDSLCYPIQLSYLLWKACGRTGHFNDSFREAVEQIMRLWKIEQHHETDSEYRFQRLNCPATDTLPREGKGAMTGKTGMTWSGFRPSDDACTYGYLVPANMFAVVALKYIAEIAEQIWADASLQEEALALAEQIEAGIYEFGIVESKEFGTIFSYETDGLGNYNLMDDANVPSLLAIPYLGFCSDDDPVYLNTRRFILSKANPYYYAGTAAQGIGSPHTPEGYVWPISLAIQGLTAASREEKLRMLEMLERTDADTLFMHEGFDANDPGQYTRPWFSWANSLFSELVLDYCGIRLKDRGLTK